MYVSPSRLVVERAGRAETWSCRVCAPRGRAAERSAPFTSPRSRLSRWAKWFGPKIVTL